MGAAATISVDEFMALEQKVLQTVELIKKEREARTFAEARRIEAEAATAARDAELTTVREQAAAAQAELSAQLDAAQQEVAALKQDLSASGQAHAQAAEAQTEVAALQQEREAVRLRVEKMLADLDELL